MAPMPPTSLLSSAVTRPPSTTTQVSSQKAPVHQFSCLFTHDVRRKNTKRWQDGYLAFHTFNGRVMVYDASRNYIGDAYSKEKGLDDGDELTLERGGILVQVGEKQGVQQTDLTELLAKRAPKPVEQEDRQHNSGPTAPMRRPQASVPQSQRRYTGWAGTAPLSIDSPFEARQAIDKENQTPKEPPRKKQRVDDEHVPLWQILKTSRPHRSQTLPLSNMSTPNLPRGSISQAEVKSAKINTTTDQSVFQVKEVVDITGNSSDLVGAQDGVLLGRGGVYNSSSPVKNTPKPCTKHLSNPAKLRHNVSKTPLRSQEAAPDGHVTADQGKARSPQGRPNPQQRLKSTPRIQQALVATSNIGGGLGHLSPRKREREQSLDMVTGLPRPRSPPISTTSNAHDQAIAASPLPISNPVKAKQTSPKKSEMKPLRLASAAPRKKLFYQTIGGPKVIKTACKPGQSIANNEQPRKQLPDSVVDHNIRILPKAKNVDSEVINLDDDSEATSEIFESKRERPRKARHKTSRLEGAFDETIEQSLQAGNVEDETSETKSKTLQQHSTLLNKSAEPQPKPHEPPLQGAATDHSPQQALRHQAAQEKQQAQLQPPPIDLLNYGSTRHDAQLLQNWATTGACNITMPATLSLTAPHAAIGIPMQSSPAAAAVAAEATSKGPAPVPKVFTVNAASRQFRRVTSDTSPAKRGRKAPLKRAETIAAPTEHEKQSIEPEVTDTDQGPWSREAWDLFGKCPAGRTERPKWTYDVDVVA